jgi:hypothetical protein
MTSNSTLSAPAFGGLEGRKCVLHSTFDEAAVRHDLGFVAVDQVDHRLVVEHGGDAKGQHQNAR